MTFYTKDSVNFAKNPPQSKEMSFFIMSFIMSAHRNCTKVTNYFLSRYSKLVIEQDPILWKEIIWREPILLEIDIEWKTIFKIGYFEEHHFLLKRQKC